MTNFLSRELVSIAFKRLASRKQNGKSHLERTSALMYFLAFDAACKEFDQQSLDLNPISLTGKNNRKQVELEFTRLVLVESSSDRVSQVLQLGKVEYGGTSPEKRISSNFFTVPLKKASSQREAYFYPKRPKAPLLKMGSASTGSKWGIMHHENWKNNFPMLLTEIKEPTPHLDLAIFILRDYSFDDEIVDLTSALAHGLGKRFSKQVSEYFFQKISQENMFARHIDDPFSDHYLQFGQIYEREKTVVYDYEKMEKKDLIERILKLELILKDNCISIY